MNILFLNSAKRGWGGNEKMDPDGHHRAVTKKQGLFLLTVIT